jgi:hypothetical protein
MTSVFKASFKSPTGRTQIRVLCPLLHLLFTSSCSDDWVDVNDSRSARILRNHSQSCLIAHLGSNYPSSDLSRSTLPVEGDDTMFMRDSSFDYVNLSEVHV